MDLKPDWLSHYISLLDSYGQELKEKGDKRTTLRNGKRISAQPFYIQYCFSIPKTMSFSLEAQVVFLIGEKAIEGSLITVQPKELVIALEEDFGEKLDALIVQTDSSELIYALKNRLAEAQQKQRFFNKELVERLLKAEMPRSHPSIAAVLPSSITPEGMQHEAIKRAASQDMLFLWGPPGTGKTTTLAPIIFNYYKAGQRVLLVSNTNLAVDELLYRVCTLLHDDEGFQQGKVLRIGTIASMELARDFTPYVCKDAVTDRLIAPLKRTKQTLQEELQAQRNVLKETQHQLDLFQRHRNATIKTAALRPQAVQARRELNALQSKYHEDYKTFEALKERHAKSKTAGFIPKLLGENPKRLKHKLDAFGQKLITDHKKLDTHEAHTVSLEAAYAELKATLEGLEKQGVIQDEARLTHALQQCTKSIEGINLRSKALDAEMEKMETRLISEAKVLAATLTKVTLSPKLFEEFDAVIIDEASMITLPACSYVAGLARKNIVVGGDFRQLEPIIKASKDLEAELKVDIFCQAKMDEPSQQSHPALVMLQIQHRMVPVIGEMVNQVYYNGALQHGAREQPPFLDAPFAQAITIIDTHALNPITVKEGSSPYTSAHAVLIRQLCHRWSELYDEDVLKEVGITTPFRAQADHIKKLLEIFPGEKSSLIECGTVHRYQGKQKRIMIVDLVIAHQGKNKPGGWLEAKNLKETGARLFNVAFSRAREHLIVVADLPHLLGKLPPGALLRQCLEYMQQHGRVVKAEDILPSYILPSFSEEKTDDAFTHDELLVTNQDRFHGLLQEDIIAARGSVTIYSPYISERRVTQQLEALKHCINNGVTVECITRPLDKVNDNLASMQKGLELLTQAGVAIRYRPNMHEKLVFLDRRIAWFGSLNPLSHRNTLELMTRFNSEKIVQMFEKQLTQN